MPSEDYANIADLYDVYVNTQFDIPYWLDLVQQHSGEILELMCGTGRVTLPLIQAGHRLTAVDNSPELLAVLRGKLDAQTDLQRENYHIHQADVCRMDLGKQFKLIILPFNSFAEILDPDDQRQALKTIRNHLAEDGLFICTLHNPPIRLKTVDEQLHLMASHPLPEGKLLFWIHQKYHPSKMLVDVKQFYEEYDAQGLMQRKRLLEMSFRIIDKADFAELAERAGLQVLNLYGDYAHNAYETTRSPFMIWHLTPRP